MPSRRSVVAWGRAWGVAGTLAIVLAATIPFLSKPLHIDDPADLQYAEQLLRSPGDPYGFELDWDEGPRPAFRNYHPPLKYYYQALVLALVPFSELALHLSYLPMVLATAWALLFLGRRFECPALLVLLFWMMSPGYLPGQNAMLDVPAMALSISATALLIHGVDRDRTASVCLAGVIAAAALLTKYSSLIYLPVWLGYLVVHGRLRHWACLGIPLVLLAAWCGLSAAQYGEAHLWILLHRVPGQAQGVSHVAQRLLPTAVFLGGAMPGAILLVGTRNRAGKIVLAGAAASAVLALWLSPPARQVVSEPQQLTPANLLLWCLLAATGLGVIGHAACRALVGSRRVSPNAAAARDEAFLGWWFGVSIVIGALASPFLAMRRVVEASLPGWILLLRRSLPTSGPSKISLGLAAILNTTVGLAVAAADYEFATVYRRFANHLTQQAAARRSPIWCYGYWGWYYYPHANGLSRYVLGREPPPVGSLLVIPDEAAKPATLPAELRLRLKLAGDQPVAGFLPVRLMHYQSGAGYYSTSWGPLPYAWSSMPWEIFHFYEVTEPRL